MNNINYEKQMIRHGEMLLVPVPGSGVRRSRCRTERPRRKREGGVLTEALVGVGDRKRRSNSPNDQQTLRSDCEDDTQLAEQCRQKDQNLEDKRGT